MGYYNLSSTKTILDNVLLQIGGNNKHTIPWIISGFYYSRTVVGETQLLEYQTHVDKNVKKRQSLHSFLSGNENHQKLGSYISCIPISYGSFLASKTYIFSIEVPFLIEQDVLHEFCLCILRSMPKV